VPWASLIDTLQAIAIKVWPGADRNEVFKYLRAVNPIAMGGIAVDSFGTVIHCAVQRKMDLRRMDRLVERMRNREPPGSSRSETASATRCTT